MAFVEQRHYQTKRALAEALVIRGSHDFARREDYEAFVQDIVDRHNRKVADMFAVERASLKPLPAAAVPGYSTYTARVRRWSTIRVGGRTYSVPSRLIGHLVEIRQHPDVVEVLYRGKVVETMPRLRGERDAHIDYRHVIWSLVRKPGADVEYLRILHLAASTMEQRVEAVLEGLLLEGATPNFDAVRALVSPSISAVPHVAIPAPDLLAYDRLLAQGAS